MAAEHFLPVRLAAPSGAVFSLSRARSGPKSRAADHFCVLTCGIFRTSVSAMT
ncbi:hypothetical protein RCAP_rcc01868 [Rhodobacter capsulatus SB 1003]|uniref:Uncharacterized protein n=1 Tax=Rhodobacter capsulatus (strain ATCC BAA-309 / NBRC 16581 / SB1003) TaxID=272942 RepID=D5AUH4_RHOCB|nr:hypothetical protein RCAP_rcc01868 [Rhodobacter capsulatus SB 1003]